MEPRPFGTLGAEPTPGRMRRLSAIVAAIGLATTSSSTRADDGAVDYAGRIAPILARYCTGCHGTRRQEGGLRLDGPAGLRRGGDSGEPLFVAGQAEAGVLRKRLTSDDPDFVMPPKGPRPTRAEVDLIARWIGQGAALPAGEEAAPSLPDHWSFRTVSDAPPPAVDGSEAANPIDAFVFSRLRAAGLSPAPEADRATLVRRLHLVLHGLPPTPEAVEEFVRDERPEAYPELVERLLASPRYGERWARHWLDVVRFAESNGFETNRPRPTAYAYRDFVIAALNEDRPYDRFVREQLAGDAYGTDAGTGFLVAGAHDIVKGGGLLALTQRQDELADMIGTTGTTFLGLTLGCARCHNHKFDPVSQKDYYAWAAVFAGTHHGERGLPDAAPADETRRKSEALRAELSETIARLAALEREAAAVPSTSDRNPPASAGRPPVAADRNEERFASVSARSIRLTIRATNSGSEPCLDEFEVYDGAGRNVALASDGAVASASGTLKGHDIHRLEHVHDGRYGNARSWISDERGRGWVRIDLRQPADVERVVWGRDRDGRYSDRVPTDYVVEVSTDGRTWRTVASSADRRPAARPAPTAPPFPDRLPPEKAQAARDALARRAALEQELRRLETPTRKAWIGTFAAPGTVHRLYRGDPSEPREPVAPETLSAFGTLGLSPQAKEQERRVRLAEWIVDPANPLTPRVMANRIWQHHFGTGLVETANDFGRNGTPPSHPELLDRLAAELVRGGWSLKHLHRTILHSRTWRQSSAPRADALAVDADARLLWRFPPRRLEAEAIRDAMLQVSGTLDPRLGGPGFSLFDVQPENVVHYFPKTKFGPAERRRMIYATKIRVEQDAVFGAFDCPDGNQAVARRSRSTTPLQALNLLNGPFVLDQAGLLADRLRREAGDAPRAQVERAFRLCCGRAPEADESADAVRLVERHGLPAFCRALLNTNEFLFVF